MLSKIHFMYSIHLKWKFGVPCKVINNLYNISHYSFEFNCNLFQKFIILILTLICTVVGICHFLKNHIVWCTHVETKDLIPVNCKWIFAISVMFSKPQNLEEYNKIGLTKLSNTFSCRSTGMFKFLVHLKRANSDFYAWYIRHFLVENYHCISLMNSNMYICQLCIISGFPFP